VLQPEVDDDESLEADELLLLLLKEWYRAFSFSVIECAVLTLFWVDIIYIDIFVSAFRLEQDSYLLYHFNFQV
jgi:hypothetical protein